MILSIDAKNAALQGIANRLNEGANSVLSLYVGDDLAAEFTLTNPAQQSISNAVMIFNAPQRVVAASSGVISAAKIFAADGTLEAELDVATEVTLDKEQIYMGGYVRVVSLTMRV